LKLSFRVLLKCFVMKKSCSQPSFQSVDVKIFVYLHCTNTASVDTVVTDIGGNTAAAAATTTTVASSATASAMAVSSKMSSEIYSSPQTAALRYLVSLQVFIIFISYLLKL